MNNLRENKPTADILMMSMRAMGYSFESIDLFDIAFMEGKPTADEAFNVTLSGRKIPKVHRDHCIINYETKRLGIGQRGKLGGPETAGPAS